MLLSLSLSPPTSFSPSFTLLHHPSLSFCSFLLLSVYLSFMIFFTFKIRLFQMAFLSDLLIFLFAIILLYFYFIFTVFQFFRCHVQIGNSDFLFLHSRIRYESLNVQYMYMLWLRPTVSLPCHYLSLSSSLSFFLSFSVSLPLN